MTSNSGNGSNPEGSGQPWEVGLVWTSWSSTRSSARSWRMGRGNPKHISRLGGEWIGSSPEEKDLGVLGDEKLSMTEQCALAAQQSSHALGCIPSSMGTGWGGGFCPSAPLCLDPRESCVQLWSPQHWTELELWELGQGRPQQWFEGWNPSAGRKGWGRWGCSAWGREGCGETLEQLPVSGGAVREVERGCDKGMGWQDKGEWL